jgi:hypothetical protein
MKKKNKNKNKFYIMIIMNGKRVLGFDCLEKDERASFYVPVFSP